MIDQKDYTCQQERRRQVRWPYKLDRQRLECPDCEVSHLTVRWWMKAGATRRNITWINMQFLNQK